MTVEDSGVVDAIGVENSTNVVVLTISDHLEWGDVAHHYVLQDKLNAYPSFVESGGILEAYPESAGRGIAIHVVMTAEPDAAGAAFLEGVREILERAGIQLRLSVLRPPGT